MYCEFITFLPFTFMIYRNVIVASKCAQPYRIPRMSFCRSFPYTVEECYHMLIWHNPSELSYNLLCFNIGPQRTFTRFIL